MAKCERSSIRKGDGPSSIPAIVPEYLDSACMPSNKKILRLATDPEVSQGVESSASRPRRFADTCLPWHVEETGKGSTQ